MRQCGYFHQIPLSTNNGWRLAKAVNPEGVPVYFIRHATAIAVATATPDVTATRVVPNINSCAIAAIKDVKPPTSATMPMRAIVDRFFCSLMCFPLRMFVDRRGARNQIVSAHAQARQSSLPVLSPNFSTGAPAFSSMPNSRLLSGVSFGYTTWRLPLTCPAPPPARTIGRS
jgi:hypothetical protein